MTADPKIVENAKRIERLSYNEAAELSYFGARILHPRTVEPLYGSDIQIHIHNMHSTKQSVTIVRPDGYHVQDVIKSVTFNDKIAVLKVKGAGVGHKPGIIGEIGNRMSTAGINIYSVITSQTCINLLFSIDDSEKGLDVLKPLIGGVIDHIEVKRDIALIAVVGEGLIKTEGLAARVFSAVAQKNVNVEMFAAGASDVAYYFIVNKIDMIPAITAVHCSFFE
jgi:aspartate kinase/aspartokinase/homoserine dehydrogenase 1